MEAIRAGVGRRTPGRRLTVLRAIDKLDRLWTRGGSRAARQRAQKDESGDFTKGAGLTPAATDRVLAYTQARAGDNSATLDALDASRRARGAGEVGLAEFARDRRPCLGRRLRRGQVCLGRSRCRAGLELSSPVRIFESRAELRGQGEAGRPVRFGSVGVGGALRTASSRAFAREPVPAHGLFDRRFALLARLRRP